MSKIVKKHINTCSKFKNTPFWAKKKRLRQDTSGTKSLKFSKVSFSPKKNACGKILGRKKLRIRIYFNIFPYISLYIQYISIYFPIYSLYIPIYSLYISYILTYSRSTAKAATMLIPSKKGLLLGGSEGGCALLCSPCDPDNAERPHEFYEPRGLQDVHAWEM